MTKINDSNQAEKASDGHYAPKRVQVVNDVAAQRHFDIHSEKTANYSLRQKGHCNQSKNFHYVVQISVIVFDVMVYILCVLFKC